MTQLGIPASVARAFALTGSPERLPGGEGHAFRVDEVIAKPVDDAVEAFYIADIMDRLTRDRVDDGPMPIRLPRPVRALGGGWVFDGWAAWERLPGEHQPDWPRVIAAGTHLNAMLAGLPRPAHLHDRAFEWTIGDLVAFEELDSVDIPPVMNRLVDTLTALRKPLLSAQPQLIHGDLTGNVLFHDALPPAVIDFMPFYRPPGYATAGVVVDAVIWHGAPLALALLIEPAVDRYQLLLRALIYRIITSAHYWSPSAEAIARESSVYGAFVDRLADLLRWSPR